MRSHGCACVCCECHRMGNVFKWREQKRNGRKKEEKEKREVIIFTGDILPLLPRLSFNARPPNQIKWTAIQSMYFVCLRVLCVGVCVCAGRSDTRNTLSHSVTLIAPSQPHKTFANRWNRLNRFRSINRMDSLDGQIELKSDIVQSDACNFIETVSDRIVYVHRHLSSLRSSAKIHRLLSDAFRHSFAVRRNGKSHFFFSRPFRLEAVAFWQTGVYCLCLPEVRRWKFRVEWCAESDTRIRMCVNS